MGGKPQGREGRGWDREEAGELGRGFWQAANSCKQTIQTVGKVDGRVPERSPGSGEPGSQLPLSRKGGTHGAKLAGRWGQRPGQLKCSLGARSIQLHLNSNQSERMLPRGVPSGFTSPPALSQPKHLAAGRGRLPSFHQTLSGFLVWGALGRWSPPVLCL